MFNESSPAFTRREFLHNGLVLASAAATIPAFINSSARAMAAPAGLSSIPGVPEDHILVVVQLSGGNDGLNTVVPFGIDQYYKVRQGIAIPAKDALRLGKADGVGMHPQMTAFKELFDEGNAAVIQGVGYPNPNRSHFKSMDIWHTADTSATGDGWLGRYFDAECCGYGKGESGKPEGSPGVMKSQAGGPPGIAIGRSAPLAMQGRMIKPVSFESPELFKWSALEIKGAEALKEPYGIISKRETPSEIPAESNAAFLIRTSLDAQVSSDLIRKAVAQKSSVQYPQGDLGRELSMIASMIKAGLKTRVYYATHGSFDTHAGQGGAQGRHANLLKQFADAIKAFYQDLRQQGNADRVLTMSFSEFGRRVSQNASQGTDHGTAAPMFLFGPMVKPGVFGDHPSLTDLDDGDLKYRVDFRTVYAGILNDWLKADAKVVLEGNYKPMQVLAKKA